MDQVRRTIYYAEDDPKWWLHDQGQAFCLQKPTRNSGSQESNGTLVSPMPGKILEVQVTVGQKVQKGDLLMVMEAMKWNIKFSSVRW